MRKFGIEIETLLSFPTATRVFEQLVESGDIPRERSGRYSVWSVTTDGSVYSRDAHGYQTYGSEIVSPILEMNDDNDSFSQIRAVCKALADAGAVMNNRCGLHVHINAEGMDVNWVRNVIKRYNAFQNTIDKFVPAYRGQQQQRRLAAWEAFCASNERFVNTPEFERAATLDQLRSACDHSKYQVINIDCLARTGTIEFRQFAGTVDAEKIIKWVTFLQEFVESCRPVAESRPARTPRCPGRPGRRNHKRVALVKAWQEYGYVRSVSRLAAASGMTHGSIVATMSYLRSDLDISIKKRGQLYMVYGCADIAKLDRWLAENGGDDVVTLEPAASTPADNDNVFRGISLNIASFLRERAFEIHGEMVS